jgi:hypothetical protein
MDAIRQDKWSARERAVARRLTLAIWGVEYRNAAVIKRIAALRAARTIIETLEGGD